jgi:hypothetical protein
MIFRSSESAERFRVRQFIDNGLQSVPNSGETYAPRNWESDSQSLLSNSPENRFLIPTMSDRRISKLAHSFVQYMAPYY